MDFIKSKVCYLFFFIFKPLINSFFLFVLFNSQSPTNNIKEEINNKMSSKISDFSSVATSFKTFPKVDESKTVIGVDLLVE